MFEKRLNEIKERKEEIRKLIEGNEEMNLDDLEKEVDLLDSEEKQLRKKLRIAQNLEEHDEVPEKEEDVEDENGENVISTRNSKISKEVRSFLRYMMSGGHDTRGVTLENGQAVVPEELDSEIIREMREVSDVMSFINIKNIRGTLRVGNLTPIEANADKDGATITANGGTTGEITFGSYRTSAKIELGVGLDYESIAEFKNAVVEELALSLALKLESQIMASTVVANQAESMFAKDYGASQKMEVKESEFSHKTLAALKGKILRAYGKRASYVINTETFHNKIEGMVGSDGHPIYNDAEEKLLKKPVIISDAAPKDKILFGYGKRYWYNYNMAPQIASSDQEKFSDGIIVHRALAFGDGKVMDKKAFAVLTITPDTTSTPTEPENDLEA